MHLWHPNQDGNRLSKWDFDINPQVPQNGIEWVNKVRQLWMNEWMEEKEGLVMPQVQINDTARIIHSCSHSCHRINPLHEESRVVRFRWWIDYNEWVLFILFYFVYFSLDPRICWCGSDGEISREGVMRSEKAKVGPPRAVRKKWVFSRSPKS